MNSSSKVITALVIGIAAGALAGILLAPDKGSETRRKISEEGEKLAGSLKKRFQEAKSHCGCEKKEMESAVEGA